MVVFPGTKLNLGLHVVSKRADGYHDLESCFYPCPWSDVVEVVPAGVTRLHSSGIIVSGPLEHNLAYKAWKILADEHGCPPADIYLHKLVPMGAGLGGGSADAVAVLKACNQVFNLGLAVQELLFLAARLGSDCPFFVADEPAMVMGRGEVLASFDLSLNGWHLTLIHPGVSVSTAKAFAGIRPTKPIADLAEILAQPVQTWQGVLVNDFESSVIPQLPIIGAVKEALLTAGGIYVAMSGSGSTVFALSQKALDLPAISQQVKEWGHHVSGFTTYQTVL